jgi:hypothetical protein
MPLNNAGKVMYALCHYLPMFPWMLVFLQITCGKSDSLTRLAGPD